MNDEFLANMSHELRTPLTAILGMAEGLQSQISGPATEQQKDSYNVILQSGAHLFELINEVLDLAKIEAGSLELEFTDVDVQELCDSSLKLMAGQAKKKNLELNISVHHDLPHLQADERRVRQILLNLLSNAVKLTPAGGSVSLDVRRLPVGNDGTSDRIVFSVSDTGIDIEESKLESLFQPFVQIDASLSRNYEGTGLGLSLVKQFAELHGGCVSATSRMHVGSCFRVELPVLQEGVLHPSQSPPAPNQIDQSKRPDALSRKARILLAEDNEMVRKATLEYLNASGFNVEIVTDGEAAVRAARELLPDLILMDIQLPILDGLKAIRTLRATPALAQTPIIAITGLAMRGDSKRCLEAGADHYVGKPYSMHELVELVRRLLSQDKVTEPTLRSK